MGAGMLLFAQARWRAGLEHGTDHGHFWIRGAVLILIQFLAENPLWKAGPGNSPGRLSAVVRIRRDDDSRQLSISPGPHHAAHPDPGPAARNRIAASRPEPVEQHQSREVETGAALQRRHRGILVDLYGAALAGTCGLWGMLFGHWLLADQKKAYQKGLWIGIVLLVLFVILRAADGFGNIRPRAGNTWIDFLNVVKYPPSLTFTFLTMEVNLIVLWGFSKAGKGLQTASKPLVAFGSAPLFVYVLHLCLYMLMGRFFAPFGTSLPVMYLYWLLRLALLYLPALWYGRFKQSENPLRGISGLPVIALVLPDAGGRIDYLAHRKDPGRSQRHCLTMVVGAFVMTRQPVAVDQFAAGSRYAEGTSSAAKIAEYGHSGTQAPQSIQLLGST